MPISGRSGPCALHGYARSRAVIGMRVAYSTVLVLGCKCVCVLLMCWIQLCLYLGASLLVSNPYGYSFGRLKYKGHIGTHMLSAKEQFLEDSGFKDEGWTVTPRTHVLVCPCGHKIEDDGQCPNGHESPIPI